MTFDTATRRKFLKRILPPFLAAAFSIAGTASGASDLTEMSLESLMNVTVVGASRYEQKSSEAPSYASVVTSDDIRKNGYRNLADILRAIPGLHVTNDRNYSYVGVRGFLPPGDYNTRVLLLVDGHRINNSIYDQAMIGNDFPVDIDLVDRVEIVRGPSSSLYGSNAFFGIINVITKRGGDIDGAELSGSAGRWRTFQGRGTLGRNFAEGPELLASGTVSRSEGQDLFFPEFDDPATNNGVAENADAEKFSNLFAKAAWGDFTWEGSHSYRRKWIPTAPYLTTFNTDRTYTVDQLTYMDLRYEKDFSGGLNVLARTFYDDYQYWGDFIYFPGVNMDSAKGRSWGAELKTVKSYRNRHRVTAGGEYRSNFRQEQKNFDVGAPGLNLDSRRSSNVAAAYLQDEFRFRPEWILNAGIRFDYYSTFGGTWNPRVGLIWRPREKTTAKLLYGRAFRAPNDYELHYGDNLQTQKANPGLHPEVVHSFEAVLEQYAEAFGVQWKGTAAAFHYRIRELIHSEVDPADGLIVFNNHGSILANGGELELEGKTPGGFSVRASYARQRSKTRESGTLPNSPEDTLKVNLVFPLVEGTVFLSPEAQYIGRRKTLPGKATGSVGGYTAVNATLLALKLPRELELSASVYNIFDRRFADPAGPEHLQDSIPQDGRNFRIKATCRF